MEAGTEFLRFKKCPVCGNLITVIWPHLWAYKRKNVNKTVYYCSWKCLRKTEKEAEEDKMERKHIITKEIREKAIRIAINGEDPKHYLEECGCSDPAKAWQNIRQKMKTEDPDAYAALQQKPEKTKENKQAEEFMNKCRELDLKVNEKYPITKPLEHSGMKAIGWRGECGKFFYDEEHGLIEYDNGSDELSMSIEEWRKFMKELPTAAKLMGIEL